MTSFNSIFLDQNRKQLLPRDHSSGTASSLRICSYEQLFLSFSALLSVSKSNPGRPSPPSESGLAVSSRLSLFPPVSLVSYDRAAAEFARFSWYSSCLSAETFKTFIQYCRQTRPLRGGFLRAQCQFPAFFCCHLSTFNLILQDSGEIPQQGGKMNNYDQDKVQQPRWRNCSGIKSDDTSFEAAYYVIVLSN